MRPFIVEFLGTPEAGKTTSVKMLRRSLEEKGYKVGLVSWRRDMKLEKSYKWKIVEKYNKNIIKKHLLW